MPAAAKTAGKGAANAVLFFALFAVWEVLDRVTKMHFDSALNIGQTVPGPLPGIFTCTLVHNTGGAWGMLSSATMFLGIFSLVLSILIAIYALRFNRGAALVETAALALVAAGGFGNAVDRFAMGYVVDFINLSFIEFPVFNIADIGVTVGMIIFFVALLARTASEARVLRSTGGQIDVSEEVADRASSTLSRPGSEPEAEVVALLESDGTVVELIADDLPGAGR